MSIFDKKRGTGRGTVPLERVKALLLNNAKENNIIDALAGEGFSPEEIDMAMAQVFQQAKMDEEELKASTPAKPTEEQQPEPQHVEENFQNDERPTFAPLFVKLERYKDILTSLEELRGTMEVIKSAFMTLNEMDMLRYENMKIVQSTIETVDRRLASLDSEFLRPSGFQEQAPSIPYREGLESDLGNLKGEIEQLKGELKTLI